jgi:hypothetical protein
MSGLTGVELACGMVLGSSPAPLPGSAGSPVATLEASLRPALERAPCLVSFSGGRDSSLVLAVAVGAARRAGLPDPIPATIRAPAVRAADESAWQERVVGRLGVQDWIRIDVRDELDAVGEVARAVLRRHGLLWPFNAHFHEPLLAEARGGSLLTGVGGDELFRAAVRSRAGALIGGHVRPRPRDVGRLALAAAPLAVRRRRFEREVPPLPWLTPSGARAVRRGLAVHSASEPALLGARMRWALGLRYLAVGTRALGRLAADHDVAIAHPLLDPATWAAVAAAAPRQGFADRTHVMRSLFGGLLEPDLLAREDKATFDAVFFAEHARAFVHCWSGAGVPGELVDVEALRAHWLGEAPLAQSLTLLQAAWLASGADRPEEPLDGLREHRPLTGAAEAQHR